MTTGKLQQSSVAVEQIDGFYITAEGEYLPIDEAERHAKTARVDHPEDTPRPDNAEDEMENQNEDDFEEGMMEAKSIKARKAPREPSEEEERCRHEATHLPYRSWCQHCVRGRGQKKAIFQE